MPKLTLELDLELYRLLVQAARSNGLSLEDECLRRLEGGVRRSRYMEALLAELRAAPARAERYCRPQSALAKRSSATGWLPGYSLNW